MASGGLRYKYQTADVMTKLIVINVLIFLIVRLLAFFFQVDPEFLVAWLVLPEEVSEFITQPWSILSYSFLHFGFFHILFNMIWLYMFGRIILNLYSEKRLLTVYLLGAAAGGVLFALSYNLFPVFSSSWGYLIGASGAVTALMAFIATATPNTEMRLFIWNIKLWHIAVTLILIDLIRISTSSNAGGLLAHLGGAAFGYIYARQLASGNDIGKWFENFIDWVGGLFKTRKQQPFKKVHRTPKRGPSEKYMKKDDRQEKVDAILDKIGKSGYDSLTKAEKDFLIKAGKDK